MKELFLEMVRYTDHWNGRLAHVFTDGTMDVPDRARKIFSHMLNAHNIWNNRISGLGMPFGIWQLHSPLDYAKIAAANYSSSMEIINNRDLHEIISYSNSQGTQFTNSISDVLFQVINHSTYHRGQLAMLFRDHGVEPLATDYILFKR